jgi:hypothetical protein
LKLPAKNSMRPSGFLFMVSFPLFEIIPLTVPVNVAFESPRERSLSFSSEDLPILRKRYTGLTSPISEHAGEK